MPISAGWTTGEMEFAIFLPQTNEPVYHSTKLDVYKQSQEVLRALDFVDPAGFVRVDARLARKIIEDYPEHLATKRSPGRRIFFLRSRSRCREGLFLSHNLQEQRRAAPCWCPF